MAIKFEKKVIIGSLFSFLATVVGIIAVFFPDLLNLQKEKVETFKMDIVSDRDVKKFYDFLTARSKDGKVFQLDVDIAAPPYYGKSCPSNTKHKYSERIYVGNKISSGQDYFIDEELNSVMFNFGSLYDEYKSVPEEIIKLHWWDYNYHKRAIVSQEMKTPYIDVIPLKNINNSNIEYKLAEWKEFNFPKKSTHSEEVFLTDADDVSDACLSESIPPEPTTIKGIFYANEDNPEVFELMSKELLKIKNY